MDTIITRTESVRGGDIADFKILAYDVLHLVIDGCSYQLGCMKHGRFAYFDPRGNHRACSEEDLARIIKALDLAAAAGYELCNYAGTSGHTLCQWDPIPHDDHHYESS